MEAADGGCFQGDVFEMILLFPRAAKTTDGQPSPKDYSHFEVVVKRLSELGFEVHQALKAGEATVPGCKGWYENFSLKYLMPLIQGCETWISVDSFAQHFAWTIKEPGVAIFGQSDPLIFGHPENINLLKDRKFLRDRQFGLWSQTKAFPEMWVGPEAVVNAVLLSVEQRKRRGTPAQK